MNKAELVAALAESMEVTKKDAEKFLKAFEEVVTDELRKGGKVQLVGFGTFEVGKRPARSGINPRYQGNDRDSGSELSEVQGWQGPEGCRQRKVRLD